MADRLQQAQVVSKGGLDKLVAEVAPNAILNAGGRADEVRCFPGTREEIIGKLENFMDDKSPGRKRMMWLSGPAGAGKSAICQTVAERREEQGQQAAHFFFFRADSTRSHSKPLVATLVYQLRDFYPALDELLSGCLKKNPLICSASIEAQFKQLISSPFRTIRQSKQIVIIIDGLDECSNYTRDQDQILTALHTLAHAKGSPFLILVSSRAEPQLVMTFNRLGSSVQSIFLNEDYQPERDIYHFVVAKFIEIKRGHHLARTLGKKWPTPADIDAIIKKSSGQFIYAATVMRFIQFSSSSPALNLVTILEMSLPINYNPLAHLDAVYSHIFSKAHNIRAVKLILFARYCTKSPSFSDRFVDALQLVGYDDIKVESILADLVAIIKVVPGTRDLLKFYHASLDDYLNDKSRSTVYCVNENELAAQFSSMCLRNFHNTDSIEVLVDCLSCVQKPTPQLSESLLAASTRHVELGHHIIISLHFDRLMTRIEKVYWEHDKDQFKVLLQSWTRFVHINNVDKVYRTRLVATNSLASSYYAQYWMTERYSGHTQSKTQVFPVTTSPSAAIGNPFRNLTIRRPEASPGNNCCSNDMTGTRTAQQRGIQAGSTRLHAFHSVIQQNQLRTEYRGQERLAPPDSIVPAALTRSNTQIAPATISPYATIGTGTVTPKQLGMMTGPSSLQAFLSVFHKLFGPLRRKASRGQLRSTSRSVSVHTEDKQGSGSREYNGGSDKLSTIRVKIHYQDNIHGMALLPNTPFSKFINRITMKFGKDFDNLTIKFKDEDGDKITLQDDSDYELALETARQSSKGEATGKLEIWCQDRVQQVRWHEYSTDVRAIYRNPS